MELGSYFLFLQEQIKGIIIIIKAYGNSLKHRASEVWRREVPRWSDTAEHRYGAPMFRIGALSYDAPIRRTDTEEQSVGASDTPYRRTLLWCAAPPDCSSVSDGGSDRATFHVKVPFPRDNPRGEKTKVPVISRAFFFFR